MRRVLVAVGMTAAVAASVVAAACGGGEESASGSPGVAEVDGVQVVTIVSSDALHFEPSQVELKAGVPARLVLDNRRGVTLHDFTAEGVPVEGIGSAGGADHSMGHADMDMGGMPMNGMSGSGTGQTLHVAANAGEMATLEFTPTAPGTYAFYCTVSGHRIGGMEGTIVVKPA